MCNRLRAVGIARRPFMAKKCPTIAFTSGEKNRGADVDKFIAPLVMQVVECVPKVTIISKLAKHH